VAAVVGGLRSEPVVEGSCESRLAGAIGELRPVLELVVTDVDAPGAGAQLSQARHVVAVDRGGVTEIGAPEPSFGKRSSASRASTFLNSYNTLTKHGLVGQAVRC
jgi:hypothetical protein